jgi:hypothetical protein
MILCECGCGGEAKPGRRFIQGHYAKVNPPMKDKHHTEESKQKRLETCRINKEIKEGKRPAPELPFCKCGCGGRVTNPNNEYIYGHQCRGKPGPMKGKKAWNKGLTKDSDKRVKKNGEGVSKGRKEFFVTEKGQEWLDKNWRGENHPLYGKKSPMRGKKQSKIARQRMSDSHIGKDNHRTGFKFSEESKKKISINYGVVGERNGMYGRTGEKSPVWKGGISFEPYCEKFDYDLKERVREFFDRKCYVCGKNEIDNGRKLDVHHVNYDKMVCCNDVKPLFVPLCQSCHSKTQWDREYWEEFFTVSLELLIQGECFIKKDSKRVRIQK